MSRKSSSGKYRYLVHAIGRVMVVKISMVELRIDETHSIGSGVFFIAEVGKNFIQSADERPVAEYLENAKALAQAAKDAGADAVKFQTHIIDDEQLPLQVVSPHFQGADRYSWVQRNMRATPVGEFWEPLKAYCDDIGILFFSTPMSRNAARVLEDLGVLLWKVGSGDVQDYALLDFIVQTKKPLIISSGMVSLEELDGVVQYLHARSVPLCILYCVSKYPAPREYFNLASIVHFKEKYPYAAIGFSDHSIGDEISLAAVGIGATVIEKHFSLSRDLWGSDHKVSMTPAEFRIMVDRARSGAVVDPTAYLGEASRELEGASNEFRPYFNKTLVAGRDITAGEAFTAENVFAMRPLLAGTLPAHRYHDVVGRQSTRDIAKYEPIADTDVAQDI